MQNKGKYHGTFKVRDISGRGQRGIQIPPEFSGEYAIYSDDTGVITLVPMGERKQRNVSVKMGCVL